MELKNIHLSLPRNAVKFVLFQRTPYLLAHRSSALKKVISSLPKRMSFALESLFTHFNFSVGVESFFTKKEVERLFSEDMKNEYVNISNYLPLKVKNILDIGCGIGGIDVFLSKHYLQQNPNFYLLDKTEMPRKVYYSLTKKGCYYNSLSVTKNFLVNNGISEDRIFLQEATDDNKIGFNVKFDLVISLISWGFHYPVETYLDQVYDKLEQGGVLIIDVRKGDQGLEKLKTKFSNVTVIYAGGKHDRVVSIKQ